MILTKIPTKTRIVTRIRMMTVTQTVTKIYDNVCVVYIMTDDSSNIVYLLL